MPNVYAQRFLTPHTFTVKVHQRNALNGFLEYFLMVIVQAWSFLDEGDEGSYLPKLFAVVIMKLQNRYEEKFNLFHNKEN